MKPSLMILAGLPSLVLFAAMGGLIYLEEAYPKVSPAENLTVERTPPRLARGKYLVENVVGCLDCHSQHDFAFFGFPAVPGTGGEGGLRMDKKLMGLPGTLYPRNITPYHLKDWTDGELVRVLRTGVNREGQALFPLMPYRHLRGLSREDLFSIIAYIRTLKPIAYDPPPTSLDFPMNLIVRTLPEDAGPYPAKPDPRNPIEYGKYMANATGCMDCHTPVSGKGVPLPGMAFAGGMEFHFPDGSTVRAQNLTPDKATGIGEWTRDYFIQRFHLGKKMAESRTPVKPGQYNTFMPWAEYGGMTDGDLGAIYDFLHGQVKPVNHPVEKFTAAK